MGIPGTPGCRKATGGVVALAGVEVDGCRGYLGFRLEVSANRVVVLFPGETCVHPAHRQEGLSLAMGEVAGAEFAPGYRLVLNLSCARSSVPGYLRMRFVPLTLEMCLTRGRMIGLAPHAIAEQGSAPRTAARAVPGVSAWVIVPESPRSTEMAALAGQDDAAPPRNGRLHLTREPAFFSRRFNRPRSRHLCCYDSAGEPLRGFMVVGLAPSDPRGCVVDDSGERSEIPKHLGPARNLVLLSIMASGAGYCPWEKWAFQTHSSTGFVERRLNGEFPPLVRPVVGSDQRADRYVNGLDAGVADNWLPMSICADSVWGRMLLGRSGPTRGSLMRRISAASGRPSFVAGSGFASGFTADWGRQWPEQRRDWRSVCNRCER